MDVAYDSQDKQPLLSCTIPSILLKGYRMCQAMAYSWTLTCT